MIEHKNDAPGLTVGHSILDWNRKNRVSGRIVRRLRKYEKVDQSR